MFKNKLAALFGAIIGERVALGQLRRGTLGGFEHVLARRPSEFRQRRSRNAKPHQGKREMARRVRQGINEVCGTTEYGPYVRRSDGTLWVPKPHASKFPPGTSQPKPVRWRRYGPYHVNPKHDPYAVIEDEARFVVSSPARNFGKTYAQEQARKLREKLSELKAPKVVVSGRKWRHV